MKLKKKMIMLKKIIKGKEKKFKKERISYKEK